MNSATTTSSDYERSGFVFPIPVLAPDEAASLAMEIDALRSAHAGDAEVSRMLSTDSHLVSGAMDRLAHHPAILDAVEELLGPNLFVWASEYMVKGPQTAGHFSWHQDMTYWGLKPTDRVLTAWIALGPVSLDNGCMRFVAGSHLQPILPHDQTMAADNLLSRGQVVQAQIDEATTIPVELAAGEMSLHHGRTFHASGPNNSDQPRVNAVVRYMAADVRQTKGLDFAVRARGQGSPGGFKFLARPTGDLTPDAVARWHRSTDAKTRFLLDGVAKRKP